MIRKIVYQLPYDGGIGLEDLGICKTYFSKEALLEIEEKAEQIIYSLNIKDAAHVAFAEKMFKLGYIAGHTHYPKNMKDE